MSDTKTKPFPQQPGHPENFGFVRCERCGTHRPAQHVAHGVEASADYLQWLKESGKQPELGPLSCVDRQWCAAQVLRGGQ